MTSSLRRQVDALRHASSGTSSGYIQRKKGKPSLLLTPDQAADVDLSSVRDTAVMGLQRLEAVDQDFSPFQATLFSKEAEGTLRDLQTKEANDRIDKSISAFLALLSPHFSSREAHFCLEYLIRHYKVYQYNVDAVVECCLPWHDTVAFARMVQLLNLKGSRWDFLTPVQKTGSPLPREAIARRCARDFGLLRFLCVSARRSAARAASGSGVGETSSSPVSAATAAGRAKLFSFYAATVVEALASLGSASEALLRALIPTVVHGLSATESPEYQMASYMILSALSGKGPLSPEVTGTAMTALVCKPCQGGFEASLLCALAVAQTQVGFSSRTDSSGAAAAPLLLPTAAFERLSAMESLPGVLAGLADKFDATAFLWLLLRSYVHHLPDQDGGRGHADSLTRLCCYPHWPSHSLPRLVRRLVDRLVKSYLAVVLEGAEQDDDMEVDNSSEKSRRSATMKTESQRVLRVLGQRFPQEVDAAVAKISRSVAKSKAIAAKADAQEQGGGSEDDVGAEMAKREADLKGAALSSLLVSAFAGAELAQRLPLRQEDGDAAADGEEGLSNGAVHGSIMVALEHSSGAVRARAVAQLARAMSNVVESDAAEEPASSSATAAAAGGGDDLSPTLLRRLHDEDPEVVLAITGSDTLIERVLLRPPSSPMAPDGSVGNKDVAWSNNRAATVASACAAAAIPWLSALSESKPKHPVASAARVLCGLLRLSSAACAASRGVVPAEGSPEGSTEARSAMDSALSLFLECLPGPHAAARVKLAQQQAAASVGVSGGAADSEEAAAAAAAAGKACKKALRTVCRSAIEGVSGLAVGTEDGGLAELFAGIGKVLDHDEGGDGKDCAAKSPGKRAKRNRSGDGGVLETEEVKSKGLKVIGEEACNALAAALVDASEQDSKMQELQTLAEMSGPGGRWFILESTSRAVGLASASSSTGGSSKAQAAGEAAASKLSSLLASLATSELRLQPDGLAIDSEKESAGSGGAVGAPELLRYFRVCAARLPRPERPSSLFAEDHLSAAAVSTSVPPVGNNGSARGGGFAVRAPLLGDVLVSILTATAAVSGGSGGTAPVWEAVSVVLLHGYERRPLAALAAVAIDGVSSRLSAAASVGHVWKASRHQRRGGSSGDGKVVAACRALCVAATFVRAAAEAVVAGEAAVDEDSSAALGRDLVAVFPAAILSAASDDKGLRKSGLLFISTVSQYGDALGAASAGSSSTARHAAKKSKPAHTTVSAVKDSEVLPSFSSGQRQGDGNAAKPAPLHAPALSNVVSLAAALTSRHRESALDAGELTRQLSTSLAGEASDGRQNGVARYLVAWAARLGWRDPAASALLLECLVWAKTPMRECCLPLLRHCLDSERTRNDPDNARLFKLLLGVTLDSPATGMNVDAAVEQEGHKNKNVKPKKATRGSKVAEGKAATAPDSPVTSMAATVFSSVEAEQLMHRALRTPGRVQELALRALRLKPATTTAAASGDLVGITALRGEESTRQRRDVVLTLVEVGLSGADGILVAAAARALPTQPCDLAALLRGLAPLSSVAATSSKARQKRAARETDATSTETDWVSTLGGLVELAQALCTPPSSAESALVQHPSHKGAGAREGADGGAARGTTSAEGWGWAAPLELARPLFDVLPALLTVAGAAAASSTVSQGGEQGSSFKTYGAADAVDAAEYALWLTLDILGGVLRRWGKGGGGGRAAAERLYEARRAGEDAEAVLTCVRDNPSPQTRNSGLALLSRMASLFPAQMASRLRPILDAVCAKGSEGLVGGGRGDALSALRQAQKAVESVVPALKAHGAVAGVGAHFVVQVFVDALDDAPFHARRALFSTLIDSLGEESLAIMSALLLRKAVSSGVTADVKSALADEEARSALVEFVHQTIHCSGAQAQVRTLVGLVQACHRLSVSTAGRSGSLTGQALSDAVDCFAEDLAESDRAGRGQEQRRPDYLQLPLGQQGPSGGDRKTAPGSSFMIMDLQALSEGEADGKNRETVLGSFLEVVLAFVRDHLVSRPLVMAVAAAAERNAAGKKGDDDESVQEGFLLLCEELLLFLRTLSACDRSPSSSGSEGVPSWPALRGLAYAVFETLQSLLSVPSFVAVTQELLQHQDPHLRRKALQMFTSRLDPEGGGGNGATPRLSPGEESLFVEMVPSLRLVAMGKKSGPIGDLSAAGENDDGEGGGMETGLEEVMGPSSPSGGADAMDEGDDPADTGESAVNRQTALLSLDVLARVLGRRNQRAFLGVLDDVTNIVAGVGPGALPGVSKSEADGITSLRASAFLLLATLCAILGVRAFPRLPNFFPAMLRALESPTPGAVAASGGPSVGRSGGQKLLWTSALSAVATVAASLPSFLSPYLGRILAVVFRPAVGAATGGGGGVFPSGTDGGTQAADRVLSLLAAGVEPRLLVPAVCGAYAGCVERGVEAGEEHDEEGVVVAARAVARLLAYVQEIVAGLKKDAASAALPQFTRLLTQALDFRRQHAFGSSPRVRASAELVEAEACSALVGLVMRLSEVELRPLFLHLCEWRAGVSLGDNNPKATLGVLDRRLSFYRVLDGLAGALKSIFTPYFAHVLTDLCDDMEAASLAAAAAAGGPSAAAAAKKRKRSDKKAREDATKRKRRKTLSSGEASDEETGGFGGHDIDGGEEGDTPEVRWRKSAASRLILSALRRCFQADRSGFINKTRFELLLPAIVAQLECGSDFSAATAAGGRSSTCSVGGETDVVDGGGDEVSSCRLHAEELVGPCLAQLASASGKDALWKAVANSVLMRTRSTRAGVRVAALVSLRQCFEVVGEEFLALLPECLPFLSELLEDGHPKVEGECRALVNYIEGVLGESIESYLT